MTKQEKQDILRYLSNIEAAAQFDEMGNVLNVARHLRKFLDRSDPGPVVHVARPVAFPGPLNEPKPFDPLAPITSYWRIDPATGEVVRE